MELVLWWLLSVAGWTAGLTTVTVAELVVAGLVAVPCAFFARRARLLVTGDWARARRRPVPWWLFPAAVVTGTVAVWRAAVLQVRGDRRARGRLRTVRLGSRSPVRQAFAVLALSAGPDTVVVDTGDERADALRVHSLAERAGPLERAVGS